MSPSEPSDGSILDDDESEFDADQYVDSDDARVEHDDDDDDAMQIEPPVVRKSAFSVVNMAEIEERQRRCMDDVNELMDVTSEESYTLLRSFGWDSARLQEAWFDNETKVRESCGLASSSAAPPESSGAMDKKTCPVCLSDDSSCVFFELRCGHQVCTDCWKGYLHSQVCDGKAAIQAVCPQHKCRQVVPASVFQKFCDSERYQKFEKWYLRSYVDDNPCMKWCPSANSCGYAIEYQGVEPIEVRCSCNFFFCWVCCEEAHRPAACKTVQAWNLKNSAESENVSWIMANTKKCPKCHRAIEKNQGCNHMVCSKSGGCGHEFCWLCLGEWSTHGSGTGGYYQCNLYEKQAKEGKHDAEERNRAKAKHALDKYMFYFERFMNHDKGMKYAVKERADVELKVQTLHDKHGYDIIELQFLYDALEQVAQSRRVLKWTYVYGYYLEDGGAEKNLFEHLQKNLEEKIDYLHEMIEKDFDCLFFTTGAEMNEGNNREAAHLKFMDFRSHVTNFTKVTEKFLAQILTDLGNNGGQLTTTS